MSERIIGPERFGGAEPVRRTGRRRERWTVGRASSPRSAVVSVVMVAAMTAAAMVPWWPVYESRSFVVAAAVAILVGSVIGVIGAVRRWPSWAVVAAVAGAYLVLGVPVAVPGRAFGDVLPTSEGLVELVAGTALSWKQLVTIAVPVGSYQALLVPPFLLGLIASTAAVTIALRTARPAAAALPPALLLVAGIAVGVIHDELAVQSGLAFLVACVAWLVRVGLASHRAIIGERPSEAVVAGVRRIIGASALVAVALVGATAAAFVIPPGPREVVRAQLQPPFEPDDFDSPLAGFRRAFDPDVGATPMLAVSGLPDGAGLRVATLDTYDGIVYSVGGADRSAASGQFTRLPFRLDQTGTPGQSVDITVEVLGYDDVWVPGIGRLERIRFVNPDDRAPVLTEEFHYNDVTGTGGVRTGLREGDEYRARSVASIDDVDLAELRPGGAVLPEAPDPPEELLQLLDSWAPASDPPGVRLAKVIDGFHGQGYVSHGVGDDEPSRSGHSLDRIAELATVKPMLGDGEQYAVAAALMARAIGFPARVVVGYLPGEDPSEDDAGRRVFRSDELQAWIEVQASTGAWIQVDPNPERRPVPERQPDEPTIVSRPQSALPPPEERTPIDDLVVEPDTGADDRDDDRAAWLEALLAVARVVGIGLAALLLTLSPFLAIVLAKARRRRIRRRAPTPVERIEGGWHEFTDTAADYGYPISAGATRAEQAATVGGLEPLVLAAVIDRAVYAPDGPDEGDDERIWSAVDELQQRIAAPRSWRERLRAAVSLASFGRYAGNRREAARDLPDLRR
ncbi:transglutaminaseTgpA domain-containing protein [Agromyces indicus]|uniref:TransglutaminaseTgpA domain-containing protein n=1 Tax=Agromyces indicus TaxID=758919 RepID=A0ABU1FPH2_9MICO|nr:transglutaminaseTgpA domain-containing protein [Agromyces indicus]MDR5693217.1 transglutaminaseTgpA domain-containing protein [Agromyces indicus]